ncbi:MAG: GntR family transcriptional regulator [Rhodospirillum sp.]|nr:GntR family transcriptional regulator [Rhodospirillum sp.]
MTLVETVYEAIREGIVLGRYAPESRLKVEPMKAEFGVSGTIVREALNRLIFEGLVIANGRRGFSVAPFSAEDLADIIRARLLIEVEVVRLSVAHGTEDWEVALVGAHHGLTRREATVDIADEASIRALEAANRAFHDQLGAACPSPTLFQFYSQLFTRHYRYRRVALREKVILREAREDHQDLLDAALVRNVERVADITRAHIERTQRFSDQLIPAFDRAVPATD